MLVRNAVWQNVVLHLFLIDLRKGQLKIKGKNNGTSISIT